MRVSLSALCTECGLCCDGSLFQYVTLKVDPVSPLLEKVSLGHKRDRRIMHLPCGALENRCCSEYALRPENCRRFICDLGFELQDNGLPLADAVAIVREAQRLVGIVRKIWPPPPGRGVMVHAQMSLSDPSVAIPVETLQAIRAADRFLKQHFLP